MNTATFDLDSLWDFNDPTASEERFRSALGTGEVQSDAQLRCETLTQLARTYSLRRMFDEAHQLLDEADSVNCSHPRCTIRISLERGRTFNSASERERARPLFLHAWQVAVESGEEALEVDAAHMMAIVEADPGLQIEWNEKAIATAERSSDPKARKWMGSLLNNLGWTIHDKGDYEYALELFVKAMKARMEAGQEKPLLIARWAVARCLRSMGRLDEALSMQLELRKDLGEQGDQDGFNDEEIAEILYAQGKPDEAREYFAAAYDKLSKDTWLAEKEPDRLIRLKELGTVS